jgi:hypothetical protein
MSTQLGNQNLIWGVTDTGTLGLFESLDFEQDGETTEVADGDGAIQGFILSGEKLNVSATFAYDSGGANVVPERGTVIALSQAPSDWTVTSIIVTKASQAFTNSDVMKVTLEGVAFPDITVP